MRFHWWVTYSGIRQELDVSESPRLFGLPIPLANQRRKRRFDGAAATDSIVRQRIGGNL